ncbi:lipopolysaccharide biosynthesis protein [Georgenia sp. MJ170]|uniref:lipopolysaccharide biosynthesis protein n=1 Tax=Georgenia sunbinii TaxID=3117728 RepID=UPI002F260BB6
MNLLSSNALAPAERGLFAFFLQVAYVATVLVLLGVERPYVATRTNVSFPQAYAEMSRLTRSAWLGSVLVGSSAVYFAVGEEWLLAGLVLAAALYMIANVSTRKVRVSYIASGTPAPFLWTIAGIQVPLLITGVVLVALEVHSPLPWLLAYTVTGFAAPLVALAARRRHTDQTGPIDTEVLAPIRREGLRLLPASFGNTALLRSDRLLLPILSSPAELGRYVAVATLMEMGTWPVQQWVDASLGKWRERRDQGPGYRVIVLAVLGAIGITACLAALTYLVIEHWLPPEYRDSQRLLLPLAAGTALYAGTRIQQGLMIARGYPGAVSIAETSGMVISVALYAILMPQYGAMGAAIGSAVGYLALLIVAGAMQLHKTPRHP